MMGAADYLALISHRWKDGGELKAAGERHEEYADLRALLLNGSAARDPDVIALAEAVARACMGNDHLWHDLGLPSRTVLSELLHALFPRLAARNVKQMRWKKFFYRELCAQVGIRACRAPSCGVCTHYGDCFGNEDLPLRQLAL